MVASVVGDDNSACAKLGLSGQCCPDANGHHLGCCSALNNTVRVPHAVSAQCAMNLNCKRLGLNAGNCCPTDDGQTLGCCPPTIPTNGAPSRALFAA